jgi:prolyl-tRNA synthetase
VQAIVIAAKDDPGTLAAVASAGQALAKAGVRTRMDRRGDLGLGRRITEWELKGVPVRVEIGPRDLADDAATVVRRDSGHRDSVPLSSLPEVVRELLLDIQATLAAEAAEHTRQHLHDVSTLAEAREAAKTGFARAPWAAIGEDGERQLNEDAVSVRCLQTPEGDVPADPDAPDLMAIIGRAY